MAEGPSTEYFGTFSRTFGTYLHFPHHSSSGENSPTAFIWIWLFICPSVTDLCCVDNLLHKYWEKIHDGMESCLVGEK